MQEYNRIQFMSERLTESLPAQTQEVTSRSKKITSIAFIVPIINESENIPGLLANIAQQRIQPGVKLEVIFSDNGSTDGTNAGKIAALADPFASQLQVFYEDKSDPFNIGSARRVAVGAFQEAHKIDDDTTSDNRLIVSFDADTRFADDNALSSIVTRFDQGEAMVAYGPVGFYTANGSKTSGSPSIQRFLTRQLLKTSFRRSGRKVEHFINPPYEIFSGCCTVMRESAYEKTSGYHDENRTGSDKRLSLELQQQFSSPGQIIFDDNLAVLTSARGYETKRGNFSRNKLIKALIDDHVKPGEYIPGSWKATAPPDASYIQADHVVDRFISTVETDLYALSPGQEVRVRRMPHILAARVATSRPALHAVTHEPIPHYYAITRQKAQ